MSLRDPPKGPAVGGSVGGGGRRRTQKQPLPTPPESVLVTSGCQTATGGEGGRGTDTTEGTEPALAPAKENSQSGVMAGLGGGCIWPEGPVSPPPGLHMGCWSQCPLPSQWLELVGGTNTSQSCWGGSPKQPPSAAAGPQARGVGKRGGPQEPPQPWRWGGRELCLKARLCHPPPYPCSVRGGVAHGMSPLPPSEPV